MGLLRSPGSMHWCNNSDPSAFWQSTVHDEKGYDQFKNKLTIPGFGEMRTEAILASDTFVGMNSKESEKIDRQLFTVNTTCTW